MAGGGGKDSSASMPTVQKATPAPEKIETPEEDPEAIQAAEDAEAAERLAKGASSTIKTSLLDQEEEADVEKAELLGG